MTEIDYNGQSIADFIRVYGPTLLSPSVSPPPLKGTPPNPARMNKAQRKAAKREQRTRSNQ